MYAVRLFAKVDTGLGVKGLWLVEWWVVGIDFSFRSSYQSKLTDNGSPSTRIPRGSATCYCVLHRFLVAPRSNFGVHPETPMLLLPPLLHYCWSCLLPRAHRFDNHCSVFCIHWNVGLNWNLIVLGHHRTSPSKPAC